MMYSELELLIQSEAVQEEADIVPLDAAGISEEEEELGMALDEIGEDLLSFLNNLDDGQEKMEDESFTGNPMGSIPLQEDQPQVQATSALTTQNLLQQEEVAADLVVGSPGETLNPANLERTFTVQDEIAEIQSMTVSEMVSAESDLHGITSCMSNLWVGGEPPDLKGLEDELLKLPCEKTATYYRAVKECPDLVSDERKVAFLEREDNNPALAALRIASYWEFKLALFGPERCFLPMTLHGAMKDEALNIAERRTVQLLPVRDTAGRAILFFDPSHRDFSVYSVEQEIMAVWYLLAVAMEDSEVRRRGVVFVFNGRHTQKRHTNTKFMQLMKTLSLVGVGRCRAIHACNSSFFASFAFHPVLKLFMGREFRRRFKLHYGETNEVLKSLEGFGLPKDRLPVDVGGDLKLDMGKWVSDRMALEKASRLDPHLLISNQEIDIHPDSGPAAKRIRKENTLSLAEKEMINSILQHNNVFQAKTGRRSDPRMTRAVVARLTIANLSPQGALEEGGFVFNSRDEAGKLVDAEGITLVQRQNQLARRVRQVRKDWEQQ